MPLIKLSNLFAALSALLLGLAFSYGTTSAVAETIGPDPSQLHPSFRNEVMAILSKAGCNAGACHGNKSGKGGMKLSLRGQDPDIDFDVLAREQYGRRVNLLEPSQSLLLLKSTAKIPHEGGVRFTSNSPEYKILANWIKDGALRKNESEVSLISLQVTPATQVLIEPAKKVQIKVTATFSDGSKKDVTRLTVFESSNEIVKTSADGLATSQRTGECTVIARYLHLQEPVRLMFVPARADFSWSGQKQNNYIDEAVDTKLKIMRINASATCDDHVFIRRVYLDICGQIPTAEQARAFIADTSPDKRERLIDKLLQSSEYPDFWALKWSDILRNEERTIDRTGVVAFHGWIRQSIADNKPLDVFARELLSAKGSTYTNPPANFYRAVRDPVSRGESTAQLFLGIRLQCAQCHNHPFDRWTQDDYYNWASVFSRVDYKIIKNDRTDKNDSHEFVGEQIVIDNPKGEMKDPRTHKAAPAVLLTSNQPIEESRSRTDAVADWVTSPDNKFFARAQVNRIWFHLMGRGLVDPIDDFRATNPASHPELLDRLAQDFAAHHFDMKYMIKLIACSNSYQRSSVSNQTNIGDEINYSHNVPRRLTAEQLLDAQHQFADVPAEFAGYNTGTRASQISGVKFGKRKEARPTTADRFLVGFGKPPRQSVCECERTNETNLAQTFQLIAGPEINAMIVNENNRLGKLLKSGQTQEQIIHELYWASLNRIPTADELTSLSKYLKEAADSRKALEDIAWALLNSKEFILRQ